MISTGTTASAIFASMHWTMVEFSSPLLATSDHPVYLWPGFAGRSPDRSDVTQIGVLECSEIRMPLSPTQALLMTWSDRPDEEAPRVRGTRDHASNLNSFTVQSAERQWFYRPGAAKPRTAGTLRPLALELVPGYGTSVAATSTRRERVSAIANAKVGRDLRDREITVVSMSRAPRS
jgi:Protein of unknown function (DUF4238)